MFAGGYWFFLFFWRLTHVVPKVEKLHTKYLLKKRIGLLLLSCSHVVCLGLHCFVLSRCFLVLFVHFSLFFFFFLGVNISFATIHLYCVHFLCCWVCIVFLFSTCSFPSLLFGFFIFLFLY